MIYLQFTTQIDTMKPDGLTTIDVEVKARLDEPSLDVLDLNAYDEEDQVIPLTNLERGTLATLAQDRALTGDYN